MSDRIILTDAAITRVKQFLRQQNNLGVFRIAVEKSGCSGWKYATYYAEQPQSTDLKLNIEIPVYVDANSIEKLDGTVLDCIQKGLGTWQWEFRNPKARSNCGCGESFSVKEEEK